MTRRSPAAILLLALAASAQQPELRLDHQFSEPRPIDRVLARVDAARDVWVGEQDFEDLNKKLKQLAKKLKDDKSAFAPLAEFLSRFESLALVEFKIVGSSRAGAEDERARLEVRVEFGGTAAGGGLLSLLGKMRMVWLRSGGGWRLEQTEAEPFHQAAAPRKQFIDITEQALGANASYRLQLSKGVDYWRGALDGAVGVSVYGHHGLALGDYNGYGLEDLYISQPAGLPNRLYRNNGDSTSPTSPVPPALPCSTIRRWRCSPTSTTIRIRT